MEYSFKHPTVQNLLPYGHPMLLVDRVEAYDPEVGSITAIKKVTQSDPFLRGHFPGSPIYPGVLIIKSLSQACMLLMRLDELGATDGTPIKDIVDALDDYDAPQSVLVENRVKHMTPLFPGDEMRLEATMKGVDDDVVTFKVRALDGAHNVAGKGTLRIQRSVEAFCDRRELE